MVSSYFYPDGGGAESYAYNIAKRLIERGHSVTVLCSGQEKRKKEEMIDGIRIVRLKPDFMISTAPIKIGLLFDMINFVRNGDFDLIDINFHLPYYPDIAALVSKICKIPSVLTYHNDIVKGGSLMNSIAQIYNYSVNHVTLRSVNLIITPSPFCYNESKFLKPFTNKLVWIPPGVDIEKYSVGKSFKIHEAYDIPDSSKIVLFVGVMSKAHTHKGVDQLIKSFKIVLEEVEGAYLVLVGRGDMMSEYKKMCEEFNISDNVIFTGFVDETELIEYYKSSDVVVLPSTTVQEGFGMVLIEGNACGKPVVGTRVGGIQYVIEDGKTGLLVPPKNSEALAGAIIKILIDEDLAKKMGENGRRLVEEKYTWERVADMTEKVYKEVIA